VPIQLAQCRFPGLAISSAKIVCTSAVPALDRFVAAAAGATTAAPPRVGMWGRHCSEQRRQVMCVTSSAEADRRATLSLILTGVTDSTPREVVGGTIALVATPATPVNIYRAPCVARHCEFSNIR